MGWGGVGMVTFLELAHMVGATQHHVPCTCTHARCYASHGIGVGWGGDDNVPWTCQHGWCYARSLLWKSIDVYVSKYWYFWYIYICAINGFLLPKIQHSWYLKNRDSKKQTQKAWLSDIAIFLNVQIHCACQWILTLPPKILWPTALLNTWNIITFPKSSFYHTNHTFLTNINVWMMDFWSINTRIKKISSAQITILCREWLLQKLTFRHSEITIFNHSQYPTQRTFGEPPAPSVYIIYTIFHLDFPEVKDIPNHFFGTNISNNQICPVL